MDAICWISQDTSIRYYNMAKNQGDELEKTIGCQYGIHLMEEWNRMKLMDIILERREEKRRHEFEETARVSTSLDSIQDVRDVFGVLVSFCTWIATVILFRFYDT